jgi:hypothetical protein
MLRSLVVGKRRLTRRLRSKNGSLQRGAVAMVVVVVAGAGGVVMAVVAVAGMVGVAMVTKVTRVVAGLRMAVATKLTKVVAGVHMAVVVAGVVAGAVVTLTASPE